MLKAFQSHPSSTRTRDTDLCDRKTTWIVLAERKTFWPNALTAVPTIG
jgi:hypothetical protein